MEGTTPSSSKRLQSEGETTWAVFVHGKGADPRESLRSMQIVAEHGLPMLAITYRNDEGQARAPEDRYGYGANESDDLAGAVAWLNPAADRFARLGRGTMVGIGSVAGDRGRSGNPVYCTSKAGLHAYLEALRNRVARLANRASEHRDQQLDHAVAKSDGLPQPPDFLVGTGVSALNAMLLEVMDALGC